MIIGLFCNIVWDGSFFLKGGGRGGKGKGPSLWMNSARYLCCALTYHTSQAKVWNALFLDSGDEDSVEVAPWVISQAEEDLHASPVVLHV